MNKSKYQLIIFDCDGTLVDSEYLNNKAVSDALISLGFARYTMEYCVDNFTGMNLPNLLGHLRSEETLPIPDEEILRKFIANGKILAKKHLQASRNAHLVLSQLEQKKCVASNGQRESLLESLRITGLDGFFTADSVFTYQQVKHGKPAPDLFLFAADKMGFSKENCLVIEDSAVGVMAAKAAGIKVLGFTGSSSEKTKQQLLLTKPDAIIDDLTEIFTFL